jgi:hypothetical protein
VRKSKRNAKERASDWLGEILADMGSDLLGIEMVLSIGRAGVDFMYEKV